MEANPRNGSIFSKLYKEGNTKVARTWQAFVVCPKWC